MFTTLESFKYCGIYSLKYWMRCAYYHRFKKDLIKDYLGRDKLKMKLGWKLLSALICLSSNSIAFSVSFVLRNFCFVKTRCVLYYSHESLRCIFSLFRILLRCFCTETSKAAKFFNVKQNYHCILFLTILSIYSH